MTIKVAGFRRTGRFDGELKDAPPDVHTAAIAALELLQTHPAAGSLRLHPLKDFGKPMIWKLDVFANKSWQITFELDGQVAVLRRLAGHKDIDRAPRG